MEYPGLSKDKIFEEVDRFYRSYYLRPKPIMRIIKTMLEDKDVCVRRLREGYEFFKSLKQRKVALAALVTGYKNQIEQLQAQEAHLADVQKAIPERTPEKVALGKAYKENRAKGATIAGLSDYNSRWVGPEGYKGMVARQLQEFKKQQAARSEKVAA